MVDIPPGEAGMRTKKTTARRYDPERFYIARRRAGLTQAMAAQRLDVTVRTMRNWENGSSKIPYAAYRLMRLFAGHSVLEKEWEGWSFWDGSLWSPAGRGFKSHHLLYLGNYIWMARKFLSDRQQAAVTPKPKTNSIPPSVADGVNTATAVCGVTPRQALHSLRLEGASLHRKVTALRTLENSSHFGTIDAAGKIAANDDIEMEAL